MLAIEIIQKLSREQLPSILLVAGEDEGQLAHAKETLLKQVGFDPADLTYSYFDLSETDYDAIESDLESLPFLSEDKVVILDRFSDLTTGKKNYLDEKQLKRFEAYVANPAESTKLIIFADGKLDGKRRLVKLLKREATVIEANFLKDADFKTYFQKVAHQEGLVFDSGVFELLLQKSNLDYNDMTKNIAFLSGYKKEGNVTKEDIEVAIPKTLQDNIFELTQYILKKKTTAAQELVKDLTLQGEDEIKLIAVMLSQFRLFLQVKILSNRFSGERAIVEELSNRLGRKVNPYQVKFALRDSRHLSIGYLAFCMKVLVETDYQIKTGRYDKDYLFELALLKMINGQ